MAQRIHGLRQRHAGGQQLAHPAVAAEVAGGGQHQIAQAAEAHEGFGACAQGRTEAGHFSQTTGDEGRAGVEAQLQAIAQAGGHGQHVFDGPAHLHTHQIVVGVHTQRGAVEGTDQGFTHLCMAAGGHQRGGLAVGHFLGKTGATQGTCQQIRCHLGLHLVWHQPLTSGGRSLETFAQPDHRHAGTSQCLQSGAQCGRGCGDDDQVGIRRQARDRQGA